MLWTPSNNYQNTQTIFSLPKKQKESFTWPVPLDESKQEPHQKPLELHGTCPHLFSTPLEDGEVSQKWWAVASQAKELITAWWGCLGALPTCAARGLVSKSSFCWLHRKEQRLLSVQVLVCYPGNQSRCSVWRSSPSCIGSGLTHQSSWLHSSFTFHYSWGQ